MRNLAILLLLVAILAGLTAISNVSATWHFVVPAEAGKLLYAASFDSFLDEWELYEGRLSAQVEDGELHIGVNVTDSAPFSVASLYFGDFDLRAQAAAVNGPVNNGYGVIFRVQNPHTYYFFLISSDGYYRVQRAVDDEIKILSDWIPSPLVKQGLNAENNLRVVARGDQFQFYINGEPVEVCIPDNPEGISTYMDGCVGGQMQATLIDDSIGAGQLGFVAMTLDEPGVEVGYDNMVVYGPEAIGG